MFVTDFCIYLHVHTALQTGRHTLTSSPLYEPQISYRFAYRLAEKPNQILSNGMELQIKMIKIAFSASEIGVATTHWNISRMNCFALYLRIILWKSLDWEKNTLFRQCFRQYTEECRRTEGNTRILFHTKKKGSKSEWCKTDTYLVNAVQCKACKITNWGNWTCAPSF